MERATLTRLKFIWIVSVQLGLKSSECTLIVSWEETEAEDTEAMDWLSVDESQFHIICRTARSAGNSDIAVRLHIAFPKSGSSNCSEKSPASSSLSLSISINCPTDAGTSGSWTRRASLEERTTRSNKV